MKKKAAAKVIVKRLAKMKARNYLIAASVRLSDLDDPNWELATSFRLPYTTGSLKKVPVDKRKMFANALREMADLVEARAIPKSAK